MFAVTCLPAPSYPPCLSLGAGHDHRLVVFLSDGRCSAPGSEPLTSGFVAAVTPSLTQQRSPCNSKNGGVKTNKKPLKMNVTSGNQCEPTVSRCTLHSCTLYQQALVL